MSINLKLALITIFTLISCKDSSNFIKDMALLQSRPIEMPKLCQVIMDGKDTLISNILESELKLVLYIDSVECSSCNINKMYVWDGFIEYAKLYGGKLKYYFIYSPPKKDINSVKVALLNNMMFNYPILLDTMLEFETLNPHLPKNKAMHTFLLDENNKVILVGNPLYNKEIEKLFYQKTQELLSK